MEFKVAGIGVELRPNWKITLFYVIFMPLLLWLGFWQLDRAAYKEQIAAAYAERGREAAQPLSELMASGKADFGRVTLSGRYDHQRSFLLDNRIFHGKAGYSVISPFVLVEPEAVQLIPQTGPEPPTQRVDYVWVERGWLAQGDSREQLPQIPQSMRQREIVGVVTLAPDTTLVLKTLPLSGRWPEVIQRVDIERMSQRLAQSDEANGDDKRQALPYLVRLEQSEDGLQRIWQPVVSKPQKHLGYAFQWFTMALVLTGLYLYVTFAIKKIVR